jgi:hypothetical protein
MPAVQHCKKRATTFNKIRLLWSADLPKTGFRSGWRRGAMNAMKAIIIGCIMFIFYGAIGFADTSVGGYTKELIVSIPWGEKQGEVGLYKGHDGPPSFTVDSKGLLYLVDSGNSRVLIYNEQGDLVTYFSLDNHYAHNQDVIEIDEKENAIYILSQNMKQFSVYSTSGKRLKTIKYEGLLYSAYKVNNGIINVAGRMLATDDRSEYKGKGQAGEDVFVPYIWDEPEKGRYQYEKGKYSGTIIKRVNSSGSNLNGLYHVIFSDNREQELNIEAIVPDCHVYYWGESKNKQMFFVAYSTMKLNNPSVYVLKYDQNFNLVTLIDDSILDQQKGYHFNKHIIMTDEGYVYSLFPDKDELKVYKWIMK